MAAMESTYVKNCRVNHAGFSPAQWVMGKLPDDVTSLTVEQAPTRLGVQEEMMTGATEFAQQLNIRQAAKEAFEHADSSRRIRTSLLRRLVCFFRLGRWYGPARVIGREGRSNLWLIHGGIPIAINEESRRPALQGEVVAKQLIELRPSRKRRRQIMQDCPGEGLLMKRPKTLMWTSDQQELEEDVMMSELLDNLKQIHHCEWIRRLSKDLDEVAAIPVPTTGPDELQAPPGLSLDEET